MGRPRVVVLATRVGGLLKISVAEVVEKLQAETSGRPASGLANVLLAHLRMLLGLIGLLAVLLRRPLAGSSRMWWTEPWTTLSAELIAGWLRALLTMMEAGLSKRLPVGQLK